MISVHMKKIIKRIYFFFKRIQININNKNIYIAPKCRIYPSTSFEGNNRIGEACELRKCSVGKYSYMGCNCIFQRTSIGRFCSIASNVKLLSATHPVKRFVSSSPVFFSTGKQCGVSFVSENSFKEQVNLPESPDISLIIGNDVWVGENVMIMGGVIIGNGAVIAAGAVVTRDVEPYSIVAGVPAKEISKRFTDEQIVALLKIKWWNWEEKKLKSLVEKFQDITTFTEQEIEGEL